MSRTVWPAPDRSRLVACRVDRATGSPPSVFVTDVGPIDGAAGADGLPLVLLHDVLTCGHAFARLLEVVPATRRYLVVDLPGCGESDRPAPDQAGGYRIEWLAQALAEVLGHVGLGGAARYEVFGQGFGALVAMALATLRPGDVARLFACGPPVDGSHLAHELRLAGLPAIGTLAFARAYRRVDLERTLARWRADSATVDTLSVDVYWDRLGRAGGVDAACEMLLQLDRGLEIGAGFAVTGVPAVVAWPDHDVVPAPDRARWAERLPGATTVVIERCGHAAVEEHPSAIADILARPATAEAPCPAP